MIMDMQIGVFCALFSIIASLVVYAIISFYSIKEDSFDEARANRRKLIKEYLDQSRTNCDKTKQKKNKKTTKKIKDKKPEVNLEDIEEKREKEGKINESSKEAAQLVKEMVVNKKNDNGAKGTGKAKVQTVDKEEPLQTVATAVPPNEVVIKKMPEKKGKKVLEKPLESEPLSVSHVPKEGGDKKAKIEVKIDKKKSENILQSTGIRKQPGGGDKKVINVNSILSLIQKAELSRSEIQLLIDTLLNSEDETSEWLKVKKLDSSRQDSSVKLRKQLSELEGSLKNEKQITLSLQNKLKELRSDMSSDKMNLSVLKDAVNKIQQEKEDLLHEKCDLSQKLKTITDEHHELQELLNKEKSNTKQQQKLDDDRHHDEVLSLQNEIKNISTKLEDIQNENSSLQSSLSFLKDELKSHQTCQEDIADLEKNINTLSEKVDEKDNEISHSKKQVDTMTSVLDNFKKENQELRIERENLAVQLSDSSRQYSSLKEEFEALLLKKSENENEAVGVENGNVNGFDASHDAVNYQLLLEEKDNLLKQMSSDFESSNACLNELKKKLVDADDESVQLKSLLEQANTEISLLKGKVTKLNSRNEECEELIFKLRNIINEKSDELNSLNGEIEKHKERNNELRNKNWKVVEALSSAEKALQNKLKSREVDNGGNNYKNIEELKNNVNTFVRRLFPDITVQEYKGHFNEWLRSVEEAVTTNNLKYSPHDLQSQNSQLQSLVSHYKNIISDTEDMLNKLQNHIEVEESKWKENMASLQNELDTLRSLNNCSS